MTVVKLFPTFPFYSKIHYELLWRFTIRLVPDLSARYQKYRLFHEAACIYISLLCGVVAMHVWPLRAGSPINAFWGGIRHSLLGVVLGELDGMAGDHA